MIFQTKKNKKEADRIYWIDSLRQIVERDEPLDDEIVVRMKRLHTWNYLRDAHWHIAMRKNRKHQLESFKEYIERCFEYEIKDARRRMMSDATIARKESFGIYQEILSETNGNLKSYEQFNKISLEVFEIREKDIPKFYFDLKDGKKETQVEFWFEQIDILFSDDYPELVEDFFEKQISFIKAGLENEQKNNFVYPSVKLKNFNDKWAQYIEDEKEEILEHLGLRTFNILKEMKIEPVRFYDHSTDEEENCVFEMNVVSEGEVYTVHSAEYSEQWVDWFQFSPGEISFEDVFRMDHGGEKYYMTQRLFEQFPIKKHLRGNHESDENFYQWFNHH